MLTERQQQIKDLLDAGVPAREVGEKLGITRNAVYQQIAAMRKKGALPLSYTPGGTPSTAAGAPHPAASTDQMEVIRMLVEQNSALTAQVSALLDQLGEVPKKGGKPR